MSTLQECQSEYELVAQPYDMTVALIKDGLRIASVTAQECAKCKMPGDTPEMTFARALAMRRLGQAAIEGPAA